MSGDGQQVDAEVIDAHRNLADRLRAVAVHERTVAVGYFGNLGDWLNRAHLIVGMHDGHEDRFG